jgi:hypothetical protein
VSCDAVIIKYYCPVSCIMYVYVVDYCILVLYFYHIVIKDFW